MKSKEQKRKEAEARQQVYNALPLKDKLAKAGKKETKRLLEKNK